jgi:hypothetical protein
LKKSSEGIGQRNTCASVVVVVFVLH